MHPPLFLVDSLPDGDLVRLDGPEGRHAATVRRLRVGEAIAVGDGRGSVREGQVAEVGQDCLVARCGPVRFEPVPPVRLVVAQALAKGDRAELAVELMTELGVDEIVPWAASRSIVQWQGARGERARERWAATARAAAKQSRRARVPQVDAIASTAAVAERVSSGSHAVVLHEAAKSPASCWSSSARKAVYLTRSSPCSSQQVRRRRSSALRCYAPRPRARPPAPLCRYCFAAGRNPRSSGTECENFAGTPK